ncbi:methyltransferase domain-containing protein [Luteimonas fraxinea]|uniref:methyltransferase domain-containing protein n=1 Tax=Luteimonas fraxinea TaxID=2901869 RepID=UPI001E31E4AF|nr:class I SAM-dependent methyltransferase [Luteimonas fraxinea]MCD9124381.1 class I SAM-dependent methyltransferase [Luteimonas fraxinea]
MSEDWRLFWSSYRRSESVESGNLLRQVGRTVQNVPISDEAVVLLVERIAAALDLQSEDTLLDLCCGNGAITSRLARRVNHVVAVDFAPHLIETARLRSAVENVDYLVDDATKPASELLGREHSARKFLMNAALAYFRPRQLEDIVGGIVAHVKGERFRFHLTDVPDESLKWNFYDTPERRARFEANAAVVDGLNDGLGRWWELAEIEAVAEKFGLVVTVIDQPRALSNYRMDVTLELG